MHGTGTVHGYTGGCNLSAMELHQRTYEAPEASPRTSEHVWGWLGNLHARLRKLEERSPEDHEPEEPETYQES